MGTTTVLVTARDAAGNVAKASFNVLVRDTTPPMLTVPSDMTLEATSPAGAIVTFVASATDLVTANPTIAYSVAPGSTFALGTTTVLVTATDAAGNVAKGSFNVLVRDTTPPTLTVPSDLTLEATGPGGAVATFIGTASDLVTLSPTISYSVAPGSTFALGSTTVLVTARDAAGNVAKASFNVLVRDTTPPVLTVPSDMTLEATSPAGAVATFVATATDLVTANPAITYSQAPGSTFALGTTIVTVTAKDAAGNAASRSFNVVVRDTTAPVLTVPSDMTVEATSPAGAVATFVATATDLVTANPAITYSVAPGSTFALGTTMVTVTAKDAAGNASSKSFNVVVRDTTAPVLTVPSDMTLEATSPAGAVATFVATATDLVTANPAITYSQAPGSTFALGTTMVTVTAKDAAGNASSKSFNVVVRDTTPPVLTVPSDMTVEATSPAGAVVSFVVSATDAVAVSPAITFSQAPGSTFALGTTMVTVTAKDAAGNAASRSFNVVVRDTTPPTLTVPSDMTLEATGPNGAVATFIATATDLVTANPTIAYSQAPGSTFALGTTTVLVTATDAAGNVAKKSFNVLVRDTTAPSLTVPSDMTVEATGPSGAVANFVATATDLVTAVPTITYSQAPGTTFALGTTIVTVTAKDAAGNATSKSFNVTVRDTTAPVLTVPANMTLEATSPAGAVVSFVVSASDAVTVNPTITYSQAPGTTFALGTTIVTVSAKDAAGNATTKSFNVTVRDTTAPTGSIQLNGGASTTADGKLTVTIAFTDAVGPVSMRLSTDGGTSWSSWAPYATTASALFPAPTGQRRWSFRSPTPPGMSAARPPR